MFYTNNDNERNNYQSWYQTADPREHTYSPGYGFSDIPPQFKERKLISLYASAIGFAFLAFFILSFVIPVISTLILEMFGIVFNVSKDTKDIAFQAMIMLTSVIAIFVPFSMLKLRIKIPSSAAFPMRRVNKRSAFAIVCMGMGVSAVSFFITSTIIALFSTIGVSFYSGEINIPSNPAAFFLFVINMSVIPAIFEEMAFRGVIMQTLRRFGDGFALIVSALLFSLIHANFGQFSNAFIMGLAMGYFTMLTGSLRPAMIIHFLNNIGSVVISIVADNFSENISTVVMMSLFMFYIIIAIAALLHSLRKNNNLFYLRTNESCLTTHQKFWTFVSSPALIVAILISFTTALGQLSRI